MYIPGFVSVLVIVACAHCCSGLVTVDCCKKKYNSIGESCSYSGTVVENETYYCVDTSVNGCIDCAEASLVSYTMCSSCCVTDEEACASTSLSMATSWIFTVFILSFAFLSCLLIFATTELGRDDGLSFSDAYLLPIPLVSVDQIIKMSSRDEDSSFSSYNTDDRTDDSEKGFVRTTRTGFRTSAHDSEKDAADGASSDGDVSFGSETHPRDVNSHSSQRPPLVEATAHIYSPTIPVAEPTVANGNLYYH